MTAKVDDANRSFLGICLAGQIIVGSNHFQAIDIPFPVFQTIYNHRITHGHTLFSFVFSALAYHQGCILTA